MKWFVLFLLIPSAAAADPISLAIAATVSSVFAAGGLSAFTFTAFGLSLTGLGAFAASVLLRATLGYALNALSAPSRPRQQTRGYSVNALGSAQPTAIIYGETKVGGVVFYQETTNNKNVLHRLVALAGHEVQAIGDVYLNDELLTLDGDGAVTAPAKYVGLVTIKKHLGPDDQAADSGLVSESVTWTIDHRAQGIAYIYARFNHSNNAYPNGVPVITALCKGKRVFDPRTSVTAWSDNPALCLRDYLFDSQELGADEIDDAKVIIAADICDELVTLAGGGTQKRYTLNGSFVTDATPSAVIESLLSAMGGMFWFSQGKYGMKAAAWSAPVLTLDEDDLRSGLQISTRNSRRDNFNSVTGIFVGPETNYQPTNYPTFESALFLAEDGGLESTLEMEFPFTDTSAMAQRIAKIAMFRNREQLKLSATWGMRALGVVIGDVVQITNARLGFASKTFEVVDWRLGFSVETGIEVAMVLQELSSPVFDWSAEESEFASNNTNLLSPFDVPTVGIALSDTLRVLAEHIVNVLEIDVTSGDIDRTDSVEVEFKESSASDWVSVSMGSPGRFEVVDLQDGSYDVRARATNALGVKGDWTIRAGYELKGLAAPPSDVANFRAAVIGSVVQMTWDAVADLDLSYYRIRHSSLLTGATWANSSLLITKVPRPATTASIPAASGTYLIKAVDKLGVLSVASAAAVVTPANLEGFSFSATVAEHPLFAGTHTNTGVTNSELRLVSVTLWDSLAGNVDDMAGLFDGLGFVYDETYGQYDFDNEIDLGAVRRARIRVDHEAYRFDMLSGQFDGLAGPFDLLQGNFDDLTVDADFDDTDVRHLVSTTQDDPGGTPVWSAYEPFTVADISARGFRFRSTLHSDAPGITPAVTQLSGIALYN